MLENTLLLHYMELYHLNYYREVKEKDRTYYDLFTFSRGDSIPEEYHEISFVCLRADSHRASQHGIRSVQDGSTEGSWS